MRKGGDEDDYRLFRIQGAILWTTAGYAVLVKKRRAFSENA
jgi:hypothetical protein